MGSLSGRGSGVRQKRMPLIPGDIAAQQWRVAEAPPACSAGHSGFSTGLWKSVTLPPLREHASGAARVVAKFAIRSRILQKLPTTMKAVLLTGNGGFDKLDYRGDVP